MKRELVEEFQRVQACLKDLSGKLVRLEQEFTLTYENARKARARLSELRREAAAVTRAELGDEELMLPPVAPPPLI